MTLAFVVLLLSAEPKETVVTGTRSARSLEDSPVATTVLPRAELERSPTQLMDELLRTVPAVQTFRRSSSLTADPTSQSRVVGKGVELFVASQNVLGATVVVGRAGIDTVAPPFSLRAGLRVRSARW